MIKVFNEKERVREKRVKAIEREKKRINVWATSFSINSLRKLRYQILEEAVKL